MDSFKIVLVPSASVHSPITFCLAPDLPSSVPEKAKTITLPFQDKNHSAITSKFVIRLTYFVAHEDFE